MRNRKPRVAFCCHSSTWAGTSSVTRRWRQGGSVIQSVGGCSKRVVQLQSLLQLTASQWPNDTNTFYRLCLRLLLRCKKQWQRLYRTFQKWKMKDRKEGRQREVVTALEYTPRHECSGIVNTQIHGYLTSALNRCEWSVWIRKTN